MENLKKSKVNLDSRGRVVIPAHLRRAMEIGPGQTLIARVRDGRLVLEKPDRILTRLKTTFANVPSEISLVDELIVERREEALREADGG